jgi:hypothetical protein
MTTLVAYYRRLTDSSVIAQGQRLERRSFSAVWAGLVVSGILATGWILFMWVA